MNWLPLAGEDWSLARVSQAHWVAVLSVMPERTTAIWDKYWSGSRYSMRVNHPRKRRAFHWCVVTSTMNWISVTGTAVSGHYVKSSSIKTVIPSRLLVG